MTVEITPRASNVCSTAVSRLLDILTKLQRLKEIMSQDSNPNLALRIQVESGGCHGFQYLMSLTTLPPLDTPAEKVGKLDEDDTVFATDDGSGAKIVMDGPSLELLKGSKVDFTMELIGSQFKIVDNPLATSSCGCGTSFDIKA
jgi:iron-sulfur cluster assembly accessory protein